MAKYHINSAGQPGKCKAFNGNCPFGGDSEHYGSEDKARQAYEAKMATSTLAPSLSKNAAQIAVPDVELKRGEMSEVAATSKDPAELMAVARSGNKRWIRALVSNPNANPDALAEAATKFSLATDSRMAVELHPNYPAWALTGEAVNIKVSGKNRKGEDGFRDHRIFANPEANDEVLRQTQFFGYNGLDQEQGDRFAEDMLEDPAFTRLSHGAIAAKAATSPRFAAAAARSGRFPTKQDLESKSFLTPKVVTTSTGWYTERGELDSQVVGAAARNTPSAETQAIIYNHFYDSPNYLGVARALRENPRLDEGLRTRITTDLKKYADDIGALADTV